MPVPTTPREAFEFQAAYCDTHGAPVTARICRGAMAALDMTSTTGRRTLGWAGHSIADALPLRLAAPFHALHRAGRFPALAPIFRNEAADDAAILRDAIAAHDAEIARWLDGPPQTNEPGRSATFIAALGVLAKRFGHPFELLEIGSSGGLNLLIDRYRYILGGVEQGPAEATVTITPEWRGAAPASASVVIDSVRGVDLAPVDVTDRAAAERLLAYVWADEPQRSARVEAAIAMARSRPPRLERGDAADWVEARLAEPQAANTTRVLMHSIVWQYLPPPIQDRITAAMAAAGANATTTRPLAWVTLEADRSLGRHEIVLRSWPGEGRKLLGTAHPHGAWIDWSAGEEVA